jgi:hypothetical protein
MNPVEYIDKNPREDYDCGWDGPGWYFWNEIWIDIYGPYNTKKEAKEKFIDMTTKNNNKS